ncbi:MAG: inositol monophosphatase family protein [Polaromonas sp.]|uniref:inositol monophosphatase family protein n=1 Tax=Polaromonas sp. TaxID=1869339 RepID=UPI003263CEC3
MDLDLDLNAVLEKTRLAGMEAAARIRKAQAELQPADVRQKAPGDWVTRFDREVEEGLRSALLQALPHSSFVGEEGGGELTEKPTWLVDPIDGTANFARGYPQFAVSIALCVDRQPVLGVIVDPSRQEIFTAALGLGARLNGERLACAAARPAGQCLVSTVFPKPDAPFMDDYLREFGRVLKTYGQVRRSGSMALELAYVAAGRADAFWERGMGAWDAAAGAVLLREAGATMQAVDGLPLLQSQMLVAGSPTGAALLEKVLSHHPGGQDSSPHSSPISV